MTEPIRTALVGFGYWGPNLARNLTGLPQFDLVAICEADAERRTAVGRAYPNVAVLPAAAAAIEDPDVQAIIIATPVSTHHPLAIASLRAGKHVFVEKPIAHSAEAALEIVEMAERMERRAMVGHTFVYTGAVRKLRELVDTGAMGELLYFDSCRVNLGMLQSDVDVLWDLAVHDLAIIDFVAAKRPRAVSAVGVAAPPSPQISTAYLTLFYDDSFVAHVNVNWLSPVKIRRTLVGGSKQMAVWDDVEPSEKVRVYDSGVDPVMDADERRTRLVEYRTGDMVAPRLDSREALALELEDFAGWINGGVEPPNTAESGLRVVRVLEAATESMRGRGLPVEVAR